MQLGLHTIYGNARWYSQLETVGLEVSYKVNKHTLTYDPTIPLLDILSLRNISHKSYTRIFTVTLFVITKTWKQSQMSFNQGMNKQTVVHLHSGLLPTNKKGTINTPNNTDESQMQICM